MDIRNKRILVLGGSGLVGSAIIRNLIHHQPGRIILVALTDQEANIACKDLAETSGETTLVPEWGNIFVRQQLKDLPRQEILDKAQYRQILIEDVMEPFDEERLEVSFLHHLISKHKPHIIIDSVNSATGLAYQDIYRGYYHLNKELTEAKEREQLTENLVVEMEKMLTTLYIPQIIRHIQVLHTSMVTNKTGVYIKVGTTGTGGMGLNIPYTHSEERPSRVLLSKSSLAGAHSLLLFLMGRTPGGPICKEIKPAAAVAWKRIHYGEVVKRDQPIRLYDCPFEEAENLEDHLDFEGHGKWVDSGETLKSVFIDTGENGIFSKGEFDALTTAGQMEFVTPEEIAENVILEILGDSTGHDIINALDNSIMGPTYRAGFMRQYALEEMERLQKKHSVDSVAFEMLGPPRLSKLLFEAQIMKKVCGDLKCMLAQGPGRLSSMAEEYLAGDRNLRSQIISIGLPILLRDGKRYLRGPKIKVPSRMGRRSVSLDQEKLEDWTYRGWVDLRESNMKLWQDRVQQILDSVEALPKEDLSSRFHHGRQYWQFEESMDIGKVAAWIFINEDKGLRFKR